MKSFNDIYRTFQGETTSHPKGQPSLLIIYITFQSLFPKRKTYRYQRWTELVPWSLLRY